MANDERVDLYVAIAHLERRMAVVEEGVSNFRKFQQEAAGFFTDHRAREDEKEKRDKHRARIHFSLLGAALALLVGIVIAMVQMWAGGHKIVSNDQHVVTEHRTPAMAVE